MMVAAACSGREFCCGIVQSQSKEESEDVFNCSITPNQLYVHTGCFLVYWPLSPLFSAYRLSDFRIPMDFPPYKKQMGLRSPESDHFVQPSDNEGNMNSKQELDELVTAFVRRFHEAHAGPARMSRPCRSVRVADQPTGEFACVLKHVSHCAPCLEELARLRRLKAQPSDDAPWTHRSYWAGRNCQDLIRISLNRACRSHLFNAAIEDFSLK